MSQTIADRFAMSLHWEPLLGLERESREIRTLVQSHKATHYVVFAGDMGARTLGLATVEDLHSADDHALYALAPLVASGIPHASFIFVHPHPDQAGNFIVLALRDDRPELDLIVSTTEVGDTVEKFIASKEGAHFEILGDWPEHPKSLKLSEKISLNSLIDKAARGKLSDYVMLPARREGYRPKPKHIIAALVCAVASVGGMAWYLQPAKVIEVDPIDSFTSRLQRTFAMDTAQGGASHATALKDAIQKVVVDVDGWRVQSMTCEGTQCTLVRKRSTFARVDALLDNDSDVVLDGLTHATETVQFETDATLNQQGGRIDDVKPVIMTDFYRTAMARMQALSDFGMVPSIGLPEPVVPIPAALSSRTNVDIIKKGDWSLQGDLAFMDSMTAIVVSAGNMMVKHLSITLDGDTPNFLATGTYYVQ